MVLDVIDAHMSGYHVYSIKNLEFAPNVKARIGIFLAKTNYPNSAIDIRAYISVLGIHEIKKYAGFEPIFLNRYFPPYY